MAGGLGGISALYSANAGEIQWRDADGKVSAQGIYRPDAPPSIVNLAFDGQGRFDQPDRSDKNAWAHPVIAGGRLYLRDQDVLLCYDVKK